MKTLIMSTAALLAVLAAPASIAVQDGEPDGNRHPYVGIMVAQDINGSPLWRCTGTLIAPKVFLTAGHCTEAPAAKAVIWFEPEILRNNPAFNYPFGGPTSVSGVTNTHPLYNPNAFVLHDLGVVVLDAPLVRATYGALPLAGLIDTLATARGQVDTSFTAVGYGLQRVRANRAGPNFTLAALRRDIATLQLIGTRGTNGIPFGSSVTLTNNANGGTCFGDSGGPLFFNNTNVVAAVTSYGLNANCAGITGGYRVDQADDLAWVRSFLN
jgi:hypothetical protein